MDDGIYNIDSKENLGHGIKGDTSRDEKLKNENENGNEKKFNNNK